MIECFSIFRRIVKHLFKPERFTKDPGSEYIVGSIELRMKKEQWELISHDTIDGLNLNEIDDLLAEVLKQSSEDWAYPVTQILFEHYRNQIIESLPSLNSPPIFIVLTILLVVISNRIFGFSKLTFSAIILLIFSGICILSYAMSYWDCLKALEVEQMIMLSKRNSQNNPCKDFSGEHESFWSTLRTYIVGSSESKCLEHMRNNFKTSEKYCDPLDVMAKWLGKVQMSYFSSVFEKFFHMISNFTSSSNFLTKILYLTVGAAIFVFLLLNFGKVTIKFLFKGLFQTITTTKFISETDQGSLDIQKLRSTVDELLQENRNMQRELTIIREFSVERSFQSSTLELGQELKELTEEPVKDTTKQI